MSKLAASLDRRSFLETSIKSAVVAAAASALPIVGKTKPQSNTTPLFDGKTLDGWIQLQNSSTAFGSADITDPAALAKKLTDKSDALSAFLSDRMDGGVKNQLAAFIGAGSAAAPAATGTGVNTPAPPMDAKAASFAISKSLTRIITGEAIYDKARFQGVTLRPETQNLLQQNPKGRDMVLLNRMLLEDPYPTEIAKAPTTGWVVKDGVMASTGVGRGVIYTVNDYSRFRFIFTFRHVSGNPDHEPCVLFFCTRPGPQDMPLDALGGIQFQIPKGSHWDYRPSQNWDGADFTTIVRPAFDPHDWSRVEILVDSETGTARMAVAQPVGSNAVEVVDYKNPAAGKVGPIALQIHNGGLFDEYKDLTIETNPKLNDLITVKSS